jgi:RNA polymerase sigma-70 factor, ECF subfamily
MLTIPEDAPPTTPAEDREDVHSGMAALVASIQSGSSGAMERLYDTFGRGVRFYLSRQLGQQDLDDKVHDAFLVVINAIQRGELREPERLMGFVRTVTRRMVAAHIDRLIEERKDHTGIDEGTGVPDDRVDPERDAFRQQQRQIMESVLRQISKRDREILTRFYLYQQSPDQICRDLGLTETQFRLLKSRAKQRFADLGKQKLETQITIANKKLRKSAGAEH